VKYDQQRGFEDQQQRKIQFGAAADAGRREDRDETEDRRQQDHRQRDAVDAERECEPTRGFHGRVSKNWISALAGSKSSSNRPAQSIVAAAMTLARWRIRSTLRLGSSDKPAAPSSGSSNSAFSIG
jgi:hypothetical protein